MAIANQPIDDAHHLRNILGRARLHRRRQATKRCDIGMKLLSRAFGYFADGIIERHIGIIPRRAVINLVVDIRDVADISHMSLAIEMPQQAKQHIKHNHRTGIADMGKVIDRRAADIHPHIRRIDRREGLFLAGECVVERQ